jgi:hypothetical protein
VTGRSVLAIATAATTLGLTTAPGLGSPVTALGTSTGFRMPSGLVTCAWLAGPPPGLYCGAPYIKQYAYDGVGVVFLPPSGRARIERSGNDVLLGLGGWRSGSSIHDKRPILPYGSKWRYLGFRCLSKPTGVECSRNGHGFRLSKEATRLY